MLFIDDNTINVSLTFPELLDSLREAFRLPYDAPNRSHVTVPTSGTDATLLMMPSWKQGSYLGVKIATVFPDNVLSKRPSVYANYLLMHGDTGEPLALMAGRPLTLWRTAATSALAATYLARPDSTHFLMIGAGALAPYFIRCYASLFPLSHISIWNRSARRAEQLAHSLDALPIPIHIAPDLASAAAQADIISCATLSHAPLLSGDWLQPGCHVDLVGGYTPMMREADDLTIQRSSVYVDTMYGALHEAGDIMQPLSNGTLSQEEIRGDLFDLCLGRVKGRTTKTDITLFKSVGAAIEDLAAAILLYEKRVAAR